MHLCLAALFPGRFPASSMLSGDHPATPQQADVCQGLKHLSSFITACFPVLLEGFKGHVLYPAPWSWTRICAPSVDRHTQELNERERKEGRESPVFRKASRAAGGWVSRLKLPLLLPTELDLAALRGGEQEAWTYGISGPEILQETSTPKPTSSPPMA